MKPYAVDSGPHSACIVAPGFRVGRYERRSTIITSNKCLTAWGQIVQDISLAAALADQLLPHGQVFSLKGPSWRTKGHPAATPLTEEAAG